MNMFKKKKLANGPFYTGTVVRVDNELFYIKGSKRFRVSPRVAKSWAYPKIVDATVDSVKKYTVGGNMGFRDGTVVRRISDNKLFLISGGKRRPVASPDVLPNAGIEKELDIIHVSDAEINLHAEGDQVV